MYKHIRRTGKTVYVLFLFCITHYLLIGGTASGLGYIDETGYYVHDHGHYSAVSAFNFYFSLYLGKLFWGSLAYLILLYYVIYKGYRFYLRKWCKRSLSPVPDKPIISYIAVLNFPSYAKSLLSGNDSLKERYRNLLQKEKITGDELLYAGLNFYLLCLFLLIIIRFIWQGLRYIYNFYYS